MRLSIILPVFNVAPYLAECLASILDQDFEDFEIVAVDDASTDGSAAILSDWAKRDERLRVVSLPSNCGLGGARNAGLDQARGDFVWFLDSDDWLAPGILGTAVERAERLDCDVLIVGWTRAYPDGRRSRGGGQELFANAPETFTLAQWPEALGILHVAWNKIIKRDVLTRTAIRFEAGWYEDVPFSYPLMIAARSAAVLDRVCINYRQRQTGAITTTSSDRHFEVFAQWDKVMVLVNDIAPNPGIRQALFLRMLWHFVEVLNKGSRIPGPSKRRFFRAIAHHYRRYKPRGFRPARSFNGIGQRLIEMDAFWSFHQLQRAQRLAQRIARRLRNGRGTRRATGSPPLPGREAARQ
jgi:CDP-glycerol glycerophosphotransferase